MIIEVMPVSIHPSVQRSLLRIERATLVESLGQGKYVRLLQRGATVSGDDEKDNRQASNEKKDKEKIE